MPLDFGTGDAAGTALQAAVELQHYFTLFVHGINTGRADKETNPLFANLAFFRINLDMPFRVGFDSVFSQFDFDI
jgi:hypothetical protein